MSNQFLLANYIPISKNQSLRNFFSPKFVLFSSCNTLCFTYLFNLHIGMRTKKKRCDYYLKIDLTYLTSQNYPPPPSNATILNKVVHSRIFSRQKKNSCKIYNNYTTTIFLSSLGTYYIQVFQKFCQNKQKWFWAVTRHEEKIRCILKSWLLLCTTTTTLYF